MKTTKKVVVSRTPEKIKFNLKAMPKHERDALCRAALKLTEATFKDPKARAEFRKWQRKRNKEAANG